MLVRRTYEKGVHRIRFQGIERPSRIYLGEEDKQPRLMLENFGIAVAVISLTEAQRVAVASSRPYLHPLIDGVQRQGGIISNDRWRKLTCRVFRLGRPVHFFGVCGCC